MNLSGGLYLCFWAILIGNLRRTGGNDPFQGNFPTLKCQKQRPITGCNGTLVDDYKQSKYSAGDEYYNEPNTFVFLYTRDNPTCPEFLHKCNGRLPSNTNFRVGQRLIFVVGGYISAVCDLAYFREFKDQLLYRDDYNVILIDWPWGFYPDIYSSFVNAVVVGKQMAFVIIRIMEQTGISENDIYIIGHSVGAHIAGHAGRYFTLFTGGKKIGRITGLDPAGAAYSKGGLDDILDRSDASLVDIISTNAGECFPFTIGIKRATGHANFYVNGGTYQLSCYPTMWHSFLKGDFLRAVASLYPPLCFHFQATKYFQETINPCKWLCIGYECESEEQFKEGRCRNCGVNGTSCAVMGFDYENCPHKDGPAIYYVTTELHCPHCGPYEKNGINLQGFQCSELNSKHCFSAQAKPPVESCIADD